MPLAHSLESGSTTSFSEGYNTFSFSGKEKDSESGYYYFGARYFMPTLSIWNSVDPMADKYPSLSPYNYCAWNPIKLVDPDGDSIIFNNKEDRQFVESLILKKIDGKRNPNYSRAFAKKYNDLEKAPHHFVFESWDYSDKRDNNGLFEPKNDYSIIHFTKGETPETSIPEIGASEYRVLFEETYHAWKFKERNFKPGVVSCMSEAEAWKFSAKAPNTIYTYNGNQTIMGRINNGTIEQVARGLHDGFPLVEPMNGFPGRYGMRAKYPHLPYK